MKPPIGLLTFSIPLIVEKMTARQVADDRKSHLLVDSQAGVVHFGQAILYGISLYVGVALFFGTGQHKIQKLFLQPAVPEIMGDQQLGDGKDSGAFGGGGDGSLLLGNGETLVRALFLTVAKSNDIIVMCSDGILDLINLYE